MPSNITYRYITDADDHAFVGFVKVYQNAFAGPPYFEQYTENDVRKVWNDHIDHCIVVAEHQGTAVGLSCCHPLLPTVHPSVYTFLSKQDELPFPMHATVYMSELAVLAEFRKHGIGNELIQLRLNWTHKHGYGHYVMRTANKGSNSVRLYMRLGATKAPFLQDVREHATEAPSASNHRQYLWGTPNNF